MPVSAVWCLDAADPISNRRRAAQALDLLLSLIAGLDCSAYIADCQGRESRISGLGRRSSRAATECFSRRRGAVLTLENSDAPSFYSIPLEGHGSVGHTSLLPKSTYLFVRLRPHGRRVAFRITSESMTRRRIRASTWRGTLTNTILW
jgi:hypothetical protein